MNILNLKLWKTWLLGGLTLAVLLHPAIAGATTRTVTTLTDETNPSDSLLSLREAIAASAAGDTINFAVTGTMTLDFGLQVVRNLTITGPGANVLTLDGRKSIRLFCISAGITVIISNLTISRGSSYEFPEGGGGGIYNSGILTVNNCTLSTNRADRYYAGGYEGNGGGILNVGVLTVNNCTLSGNSAPDDGGGIHNRGTLTVNNCTLSSNSAEYEGGGMSNSGTSTVNNSTLSSNSAFRGGGTANTSSSTILNTIIANNIMSQLGIKPGTDPDVYGTVSSQGHNLIGRTDGSSGWVASDLLGGTSDPTRLDPQLGPLQDNGGTTFTMALPLTSAAVNAGDDAVLGAPFYLVDDQRNRPRKIGAHVDIGAYEANPVIFVANTNDNGIFSLRDAILTVAPRGNVVFDSSVIGSITLTSGELVINKNVTIIGPSAKALTVSGNNASRVFHITGGTSQISNLRIANGHSSSGGGAILLDSGSLSLNNCVVAACYSAGDGGATGGGGILALGSTTLSLVGSTLSGNSTPDYGGGLYLFNGANATVVNSTISGNSTLDGSSDGGGGGIYVINGSTLSVTSSTIANNSSASAGGGVYRGFNGTATFRNSLVAGNSAPGGRDCYGPFVSAGYNLIGNSSSSTGFGATGDQLNVNPMIGSLADNGGPTFTHALLTGSPGIDKGKGFDVTTDQRGSARPYDNGSIPNASGGDGSDIGAFEAQALNGPLLTITRSGNGVLIAWPSPSTGFVLQQNTSGVRSANWSTVVTTPNDDGTTKTLIVSPPTGNRFYRLFHR